MPPTFIVTKIYCVQVELQNFSFFQIQIIQTERGDMVIVPWEDQKLISSSVNLPKEDSSKVNFAVQLGFE